MRRILGFEDDYPLARRVQLATNYRCPPAVVAVSRRLIEHNVERFAKRIDPAPPRTAAAPAGLPPPAVTAYATDRPAWADELAALAAGEAAAQRSLCLLARTRSELVPAMIALVRAAVPHTTAIPAPVQAAPVRELVGAARGLPPHLPPFDTFLRLRAGRGWRRADGADAIGEDDLAALDALLGWCVGFRHLDAFLTAHDAAVERIERLRQPDAGIELVTVHGAKGREWETVVVLGMEQDRFPNRRALGDARDPGRALEEERRLAYVALTRATRTLVLAYDPARPSRFLVEMGVVVPTAAHGAGPVTGRLREPPR